MTEGSCTHTSDWWKEMVTCVCCGAMYSDEKANRIARQMHNSYACFSGHEQAIIDRLKAENEEV